MTFQFGQDLEMDQLRTNHNISKILTTPFGKKEGCDLRQNLVATGGSAGFFTNPMFIPQSIHTCRTSLTQTQLNFNKGGK